MFFKLQGIIQQIKHSVWGPHDMMGICFLAQWGNSLVIAEKLTAVISSFTNEVASTFFPSPGADRCKETWVTAFDTGFLWTVNHVRRFFSSCQTKPAKSRDEGDGWGAGGFGFQIMTQLSKKKFIRVTRTNCLLKRALNISCWCLFFFLVHAITHGALIAIFSPPVALKNVCSLETLLIQTDFNIHELPHNC